MIKLISENMAKDGQVDPKAANKYKEDKDKIFGISLSLFCKVLLRLFDTKNEGDEDEHAAE